MRCESRRARITSAEASGPKLGDELAGRRILIIWNPTTSVGCRSARPCQARETSRPLIRGEDDAERTSLPTPGTPRRRRFLRRSPAAWSFLVVGGRNFRQEHDVGERFSRFS